MSDFVAANEKYERWLRTRCDVVEADLDFKHRRMTKSRFIFLRATFFRWAKEIAGKCRDLENAPAVPCIGDLHTENFGTWRDGDGRLVWGVNDFDDAAVMPYAYDLVRLATSAALAGKNGPSTKEAAEAILGGYRRGLEKPGPTLVYQSARWMLRLIKSGGKHFYSDLDNPGKCPPAIPPGKVLQGLVHSLPRGASPPRLTARPRVGGGGLGRPRYLAISTWQGGVVVREAKAWVPSAWSWAHGRVTTPDDFLSRARGANRSPDPVIDIRSRFILRRIAADSQKIELGDDPGPELTGEVLSSMGYEAASIHATDAPTAHALQNDLRRRQKNWLSDAAETMIAVVGSDFDSWVEFWG